MTQPDPPSADFVLDEMPGNQLHDLLRGDHRLDEHDHRATQSIEGFESSSAEASKGFITSPFGLRAKQ